MWRIKAKDSCTTKYSDFGMKKRQSLQNFFITGSVSKTFTAAVIMQLAEEGKFNLSESISRYIGDNSFVNFDKLHLFKPSGAGLHWENEMLTGNGSDSHRMKR